MATLLNIQPIFIVAVRKGKRSIPNFDQIVFFSPIVLPGLLNTNGAAIFRPTEIRQLIQGDADAPHAPGVVSLNGRKEVFPEIEVEEGKGLRSGYGFEPFDSRWRLNGQLEAIFPARADVSLACLYEIVPVITIWKKDFHIPIGLIVDQCQVAVPI